MLVFLYVPVAQRGEEHEFVQCGFCRRAFHPSVLEAEPPMLERLNQSSDEALDEAPDWHFAELTGAAASTLLTWEREDDG